MPAAPIPLNGLEPFARTLTSQRLSQKLKGIAWPDWMNSSLYEHICNLEIFSLSQYYVSDLQKQLAGGKQPIRAGQQLPCASLAARRCVSSDARQLASTSPAPIVRKSPARAWTPSLCCFASRPETDLSVGQRLIGTGESPFDRVTCLRGRSFIRTLRWCSWPGGLTADGGARRLRRLRLGAFVSRVFERMERAKNGKPSPKLYVYSAVRERWSARLPVACFARRCHAERSYTSRLLPAVGSRRLDASVVRRRHMATPHNLLVAPTDCARSAAADKAQRLPLSFRPPEMRVDQRGCRAAIVARATVNCTRANVILIRAWVICSLKNSPTPVALAPASRLMCNLQLWSFSKFRRAFTAL